MCGSVFQVYGQYLGRKSPKWCAMDVIHLLIVTELTTALAADWAYEAREDYQMANLNFSYLETDGSLKVEYAEIGKYGTGKQDSAGGMLVHVQSQGGDHFGCEIPYENELPEESWIALIKNGECSYNVKVENAKASNATAVLVYNNRKSPILEKMPINNKDIVAVFTFMWKGVQIAKMTNTSKVMLYITKGAYCTTTVTNINRTSVLFVSISFIVLMIISLAWLIFYYIQRFRYISAKNQLAKRLCNAAKKALSKIPIRTLKSGEKESECCAVCIELYKVSDVVRTLPCSHEFHKFCVDPWLLEQRTCPMCKMDILKYYEFTFAGSKESILHVDLDEGGFSFTDGHDAAQSYSPHGVSSPTQSRRPEVSMLIIVPRREEEGRARSYAYNVPESEPRTVRASQAEVAPSNDSFLSADETAGQQQASGHSDHERLDEPGAVDHLSCTSSTQEDFTADSPVLVPFLSDSSHCEDQHSPTRDDPQK